MISGSIKPTAENLLICDSCMNQKQGQAGPSVATCTEVRSSTPTVKSPSSAKKNKLSQNKIQDKILKTSPRAASAPKTTPQQ
ncbi:Zinc finger, FYVE/PHD-type [Artemisia annua]|uniref:Zinc finger, FYVE/PHD-type n=1 Tax=Artemisia annua TaxID=35608 RepID=A0A2U1M5G0_ARTAN|nr:Zinc finger, FYVE/PHD-type [Artemisia annua]